MAKKKKSKKNSAPKRSLPTPKMPELDLHPRTRDWIIGIGIGLLALILMISLMGGAGPVGGFLNGVLTSGFGWGAWFVPFILAGAAWVLLRDPEERAIPGPLMVGGGAVLVSLLGLFALISFTGEARFGGMIGHGLVYPVAAGLGRFAGTIIFLAIGAIGGLILWNFQGHDGSRGPHRSFAEAAGDLLERAPSFAVKRIDREKPAKAQADDDDHEPAAAKPKDGFTPRALDSNMPYEAPALDLLSADKGKAQGGDIRSNMGIIKRTFGNFNIPVEMGEVTVGPTVTQYTLKPAEGIQVNKIRGFDNDLALALAAHPIRIEAPIPGRSLVGIEVPNHQKTLVRLRTLLEEEAYRDSGFRLPLAIGRNVAGHPVVVPLEKMPHLLVAGATGTGKTVGLNTLIMSLLYRNPPSMLRLILIDPKRVEFPVYNDIPHLLTPVIVDTEKTVHALRWAVGEMERRFDTLSEARSRDIESYNSKRKRGEDPMPYIVIVVDELADLMASRGRDVEAAIVRLAQMARAVGIHLIVATQRPSVEVITGLIKANITTRMAFQVASQVDSRTIIDTAGAEKLLGNGDMLFVSAESSKPRRLQAAYVSEDEVRRVSQFLKSQGEAEYIEEVTEGQKGAAGEWSGEGGGEDDPLYHEAERLVIESRKASASYLQRRLRVGYARAARLIDLLEENGVVGPGEGAKPREILVAGDGGGDYDDEET
jgi:S-DNA-T family DNA segregation ATPase FtsK/SpoIIIE